MSSSTIDPPTSSLIFPSASTGLSSTLSSIRRSTLSIHNRLQSILEDAAFVDTVAEAYSRPVISNERCGSWYVDPARKAESAYFKSTDGHMGFWGFSLRRLNLGVLEIVGRAGGCVLVDSTRRGKSMPDALSKTVPIWCAVLNRLLFPERVDAHSLHTSEQAVSRSEHSQIEAKLERFVEQAKELQLNVESLRKCLSKPLRPIWVTRESVLPDIVPQYEYYHPLILCTSSKRVHGAEASEGGYIQGAGDDSEAWAQGLTPQTFWRYKKVLMASSEEDMPSLIEAFTKELAAEDTGSVKPVLIRPTSTLFIASLPFSFSDDTGQFDQVVVCAPKEMDLSSSRLPNQYLHLVCGAGKIGSKDLRKELPKLNPLNSQPRAFVRTLVLCPTGKDFAVGIALALLCLCYEDNGDLRFTQSSHPAVTKLYIRQRLSWIMASMPYASPSRATLQAVNVFLMDRPRTGSICPCSTDAALAKRKRLEKVLMKAQFPTRPTTLSISNASDEVLLYIMSRSPPLEHQSTLFVMSSHEIWRIGKEMRLIRFLYALPLFPYALSLPILIPRRVPDDPGTPDLAHSSILARPDPPGMTHVMATDKMGVKHPVLQQFKDRVHAIVWIFATPHETDWMPVTHHVPVTKPFPMPRPLEHAEGAAVMAQRAREEQAKQFKGKWWRKDPLIGFEGESVANHLTPEAREAVLNERAAARARKAAAKAAKKKARKEKKERKKKQKHKKLEDAFQAHAQAHDLAYTDPTAALRGTHFIKPDDEFTKPGYKEERERQNKIDAEHEKKPEPAKAPASFPSIPDSSLSLGEKHLVEAKQNAKEEPNLKPDPIIENFAKSGHHLKPKENLTATVDLKPKDRTRKETKPEHRHPEDSNLRNNPNHSFDNNLIQGSNTGGSSSSSNHKLHRRQLPANLTALEYTPAHKPKTPFQPERVIIKPPPKQVVWEGERRILKLPPGIAKTRSDAEGKMGDATQHKTILDTPGLPGPGKTSPIPKPLQAAPYPFPLHLAKPLPKPKDFDHPDDFPGPAHFATSFTKRGFMDLSIPESPEESGGDGGSSDDPQKEDRHNLPGILAGAPRPEAKFPNTTVPAVYRSKWTVPRSAAGARQLDGHYQIPSPRLTV